MKTSYLFWGLFLLLGSLGVFFEALNDLTIFIRGRFDEDTNPTGIPIDELRQRPPKASFIRLVGGLRLLFALCWLIVVVSGLVLLLTGRLDV